MMSCSLVSRLVAAESPENGVMNLGPNPHYYESSVVIKLGVGRHPLEQLHPL